MQLDEFKVLIYDKLLTNVFKTERSENFQDMNKPLNDYYIFSSHNTYLTGHQIYGSSDANMFSIALTLGCKLVELDCYNGGKEGPIVEHAYTMTGTILLKDALTHIKRTAFIKSDYPVILSIENHCNKENQIAMAELFKKILVDLYFIEEDTNLVKYPSPNQLKKKFIIKVNIFFDIFFTKFFFKIYLIKKKSKKK